MGRDAAIGVVGATGAVGTVALGLLRERGYRKLRAFASARSAGTEINGLRVEEATPAALAAGDLDVCLFSIGTAARARLDSLASVRRASVYAAVAMTRSRTATSRKVPLATRLTAIATSHTAAT